MRMMSYKDIVKLMRETAISLTFLIEQRTADEDFSEQDIKDTIENLHTIEDGLNCYLEKINQAYEAAGGADVKGDLNKAQKIKATPESAAEYVQNLKV